MKVDVKYFIGKVRADAEVYHAIVTEEEYKEMRDNPQIHFTNIKRAE